LLEGFGNQGLVVRAGLLQHVVEHARPSRVASRTLASGANYADFAGVLVVLLCVRRAGASCLYCPTSASSQSPWACCPPRVHHLRACLFPIEDRINYLFTRGEASGDVEQFIDVVRWAPPQLAYQVPASRALEEGVYDLELVDAQELSAALGEALDEVPLGLVGLLDAPSQVPGIDRVHVCALEVPHEGTRSSQV
jgi:hypothetical protein